MANLNWPPLMALQCIGPLATLCLICNEILSKSASRFLSQIRSHNNMYNCIHVQETLSCVNKGLRMLGEEKDLMRQNLVSLSSSAFLLLPRSVQTLVIQIGREGSATFQSSHQLNRSLVTCLLTCCPVGVNALLAEHWAVNHRSGGYSCTFGDQFPHQTPGSVVAAAV